MKKDKRAKRAKKKAKLANINKNKQRQHSGNMPNEILDFGSIPDSTEMKIGIQNDKGQIIDTITTDGLSEFMSEISKYQEMDYIDIYENKETPIDGYDAMFKPGKLTH